MDRKSILKKAASACIAMSLTVSALPFSAAARNADAESPAPAAVTAENKEATLYTWGDFGYTILDDGTIEIADYNGSDTNLVIPSVIKGKKVTSIGYAVFNGYTGIKKVVIPDSVTNIGERAFAACIYMTDLTIGSSVVSIGKEAFAYCDSIKSITIPDSVTEIGEKAFCENYAAKTLKIGKNVKTIGYKAFDSCSSLTKVVIPNSVTSLNGAFSRCTALESVKIGTGITVIDSYAFYNCTSLAKVFIPDTVTEIKSNAFLNCTSLTEVTIGNGVEYIRSGAFEGCSSLAKVTVPKSVAEIGYEAFCYCDSYSFCYCDSITDVYYTGTEDQWNNITVNDKNSSLINAEIHYNYADPVRDFVERLYTKLLVRASDSKGKANHVNNLKNGTTAAQTGANFALSAELKNKKLTNNEFVKRMYQTFLNRTPSAKEITRWATTLDNGCTYEYILSRFVASAEFKKLAAGYKITAGTFTPSQYRDHNEKLTAYVSRMYTKALKRNYDVTGLNNHTGRYIRGEKTAAEIAESFFFSAELKNKNLSDEEFVTRLYNALFDRNPDAGGKSNWLKKMSEGMTREDVFKGFTEAAEFKKLVESFGL